MYNLQKYLEEAKQHSLQERLEELRRKLGNGFEYRHTAQDFGRHLIIEISKENFLDHSTTRVKLRFNERSVRNTVPFDKIEECRIFLNSGVDLSREITIN
ncbi:hypothetical protein [Picosynechococcus sp. NKBG15041c]|uniref:hypothetical protein n=1 Tax=Picosynechococcus sp. NKBG15041c TaxID=1407650 RepID=UPI000570B08F|nr:hypothetical protein [Picosynechococcus sp. NKBG15041c]